MQKSDIKVFILAIWSIFLAGTVCAQSNPDILSYKLTLEPDIQAKSIKGELLIKFEVAPDTKTIALDAATLEIDGVSGVSVSSYHKVDSKLVIELIQQQQRLHDIIIKYHGTPEGGLLFDPDSNEAHTVYFTDHWMVCNTKPNDRAAFSLNLVLPKGMQSVASGKLLGKDEEADKVIHRWHQAYETPAYIYGFVIGSFNKASDRSGDVVLDYYSSELNETELSRVLIETSNILEFFEEKSGIEYIQDSYSQVLIGENYQEMSGLSVLAKSYPAFVIKDSSEIHLTSHELAHQWWGNMITCESFGHFWLNEAFAVYMSSAFSEHRFGREKYQADIAIYRSIYNRLVETGKDRPLIFEEWIHSRDNRNIAYYKGAYVLHLLREQLGNEAFWKGIQLYSKSNWGKSVETEDFKLAMEKAADVDLDGFFNKWVYN